MNSVKTVFLMTALACILMALGGIFGGRNGVMIMFIIAMGMNFFSYWFSDTMVLRAYKAQQVGEDHYLYRIVADLAQRADLPMPKVYIIRPMCMPCDRTKSVPRSRGCDGRHPAPPR